MLEHIFCDRVLYFKIEPCLGLLLEMLLAVIFKVSLTKFIANINNIYISK
jgi:hypothetical protein